MLDWADLLCQPVALIGWLLLALVWLAWRAPVPVAIRRAATALAVLFFAAATPLGANLAARALEGGGPPAAGACAEPAPRCAIVVLAGGMSGTPASSDEVASLQLASVRRVIEGVRLAATAPEATLILAGGGGGTVREADLMARLATALGLPPARLLLERESRTTAEGARNVARLLAERGVPGPVRLVTSAMHLPRAAASFRRQGIEVCPVPVDRRAVRPDASEALIPQITALEKSTAAWHEAVGYVVYWATGRL